MAIAFDAVSAIQVADAVTSLTFAFTTTGTNRYLKVFFRINSPTENPANTTVTYAGVSATLVNNRRHGAAEDGNRIYEFALMNPASGANNVVISWDASLSIRAAAISYTGVAQSGQPEANNKNSATNTTPTVTVTTVADNAFNVGLCSDETGGTFTADAGTVRLNNGTYTFYIIERGPISPAGANAISGVLGTSGKWAALASSFAPLVTFDTLAPMPQGMVVM